MKSRTSHTQMALLVSSLLISHCTAGPVALAIPAVADVVGPAFGIGQSGIWFGTNVVVDSGLYMGTNVAIGEIFAGGVVGGVVGGLQLSKAKEAAAAATRAAVVSKAGAAVASQVSQAIVDLAHAAVSAAEASAAAQKSQAIVNPSRTTSFSERPPAHTWPPILATPLATLAVPSNLPPGVPEYNVRMCQRDIIGMAAAKQILVANLPQAHSLRIDNIPPTCMVLADMITGDPKLGPHAYPVGSSSLQWDGLAPDGVSKVRQFFGYPS